MFGNLLSEFAAYAEAGGWVMPPLILSNSEADRIVTTVGDLIKRFLTTGE